MDRLNGEFLARGLHRRSLLSLVVAGGVLSRVGVQVAAAQDKPTVKIGSKNFTEQVLINEMLAQLLEDAGYTVERQLNLGGTTIVTRRWLMAISTLTLNTLGPVCWRSST